MESRPKPERRPEPEDYLDGAASAVPAMPPAEVPAEVREVREILDEINALMDRLASRQPTGR